MTRPDTMLMVVDVQNDFCEGGALGVDGGTDVARRIAAHLAHHGGDCAAVVASTDHHRPGYDNGGHFAAQGAEPDFVDTWPVHCVAGTDGAALQADAGAALDALESAGRVPVHRVRKGYGEPAYSAIEGSTGRPEAAEEGTPMPRLVRESGWARADVVGLALDYCVLATALGLADLGLEVRVLADMTAPVHPDAWERVREQLAERGIALEPSDASDADEGRAVDAEVRA